MFFTKVQNGVLLYVRLIPNASTATVKGCYVDANGNEYLKISVVSIPEKGKANKELISLLAKSLKISKTNISILSGETERSKKLLIQTDDDTLIDKLINLRGEK